MANKDYSQLAKEIVSKVGSKENVINVINCMTRLRFELKDDTIPNTEEIKAIKGVHGVINQGGQYQIIIGTHVSEVIKDVKKELGFNDDNEKPDLKVVKDTSIFNRFFKMISGCIAPMLGVMVASGILKGVLTILVTIGVLSTTDGTYIMLYGAANAVMYFMPVIVGFSAGKVFGCNQYVTAVIGATLICPEVLAVLNAGESMSFLKIPVTLVNYSSTLLPILLGAWFASKIEKACKKIIPQIVQLMFVPAVTIALTVPVIFIVIGPVMTFISSILSSAVMGIYGFCPPLAGVLLGAFWQLIVLLGLHAAFIPILMNNLFTLGSDPINGILGLTVWALAGVSLGYALKNKDKEKKSMGFGNMASCLCGITEPTIYSIALPNFKMFICAFIGGGIAGGIGGLLGIKLYAMAGDGVFRLAGMINPAGLDISFYGFAICALISFAVSAVLAFITAERR